MSGSCGYIRIAGLLITCLGWSCSARAPVSGRLVEPTQAPPALIQPSETWIEVDLERQLVRLHDGGTIVGEYPASSGVPEAPTPPGLYRVQMMIMGPDENVPGVFVSDILIFDLGKEIGIHSRPMDAEGRLLDARLGEPTTGGCVRVGESAVVFAFAELGMRVWVH